MKTPREFEDKIKAEEKKGNVCFMSPIGLMGAPLEDFLDQPTDGVLYDLNREKETVLTWLDDIKWVNDYAVSIVIEYLHSFYLKHKEEK